MLYMRPAAKDAKRDPRMTKVIKRGIDPHDLLRTRTAQLAMRIPPQLKALAEKAAVDDQRSLTSLVEKLLVEHLKAKGYLRK